jgi:hypothetical protein
MIFSSGVMDRAIPLHARWQAWLRRQPAIALVVLIAGSMAMREAHGQRPRFVDPSPYATPAASTYSTGMPQTSGVIVGQPPGVTAYQSPPATMPPALGTQPGMVQGTMPPQVYDPFAIQTTPQAPPATIYPPPGQQYGGDVYAPINPQAAPYGTTTSPFGYPGTCNPPVYPGAYPAAGYAGQPTGDEWPSNFFAWPSQMWARWQSTGIQRLLERPRFRYTFLPGSDPLVQPNDLEMHEAELATTLNVPNFFLTGQPLRISPGFIFHFTNGPNTLVTGGDLPPQIYSAYLSFDTATPWNRMAGGELNFTIGTYTDFEHFNSDSLRYTGVALGWIRLTPTATMKLGIEYLDRVDLKLLPAGGFFLQPTPDVRFNVYFPRPKLAHRLPNLGNYEVWLYVAGEYGGGSWTIDRVAGFGDQVDINDVRAYTGLEWSGIRGVTGFVEIGYVFERELVYRSALPPVVPLDDTIMLRMGLAF